uniref:Protein kinase domain-containing protein n=1 Tax=Branchiostoma floridae TaxID=7739 RepID=C3Y7F3_BRAFL|eukprot:XP_002607771.1 hypothetical protein BRAFLDRAFT_82780 [Branchiostoma floridae]
MAAGLNLQPQTVNGRLKLDLSNQGLTSIPDEVFNITDLEILNVSNNKLTNIPDAINRLQKLHWLDAERNMLRKLPRGICSLSNLEVLIVSNNELSSLPPELAKMKKLTKLYIHDNYLKEIPPVVCSMSNLEVLTVDELEQLQNLWYLSLSNNNLRTLPSTMRHLHNLREVYLRNNQFETLPEVLCELPEMEKLDIRNNQIARLPSSLHRADNLEDLKVAGNPLRYPPQYVCDHGTRAILIYLKQEAERRNLHPDNTTEATRGHSPNRLWTSYGRLYFPEQPYLGHGGFASVEMAYHPDWKQNIAVKRLLPHHQILGSERELLYSEARKLNVGSRSAYVISLLGVCLEPHFAIVMPYMENGSLGELLALRDVDVPWALRWRMAHEISLGMTFLHNQDPKILHCDLKTENILLDGDFHVKISDFGQSKWKSQSRVLTGTSPKGGTVTHAPPEFLSDINLVPTAKFDVYSFGVLLWEIITRDEPYKHATKAELISVAVTQGQRPDMSLVPTQPQDVNTVSKLMQRCWRQRPNDRPSFKDREGLQALGKVSLTISDFGQSKWKSQSRVLTGTSPKGGTVTHAPPEFLSDINLVPTAKFDVYSFGVLLWEIITRDEPYKHATKAELISVAVTQGQRPDMSLVPTQPQDVNMVSKLMQRCWRQRPNDRPSFKECEDELRDVTNSSSKEDVLKAIIRLQKKALKHKHSV